MAEQRTAWHYYLGLLLQEKAPGDFEVRAEEPLTRAVQHMDWLILRRRNDVVSPTPGETLVELWPMLPVVTVMEFKSSSKGYRNRDLHRLIGYGYQYFSANPGEAGVHANLALVLMVAERNGTLDRDLHDLGLRERPDIEGYAYLDGLPFPALLVDLTALARRDGKDFVAIFTEDAVAPAGAMDWWYAHHGTAREGTMDPTKLEDYGAVRRRFIEAAPLEERLGGLTPEQRMAGLPPLEQLLALAPEVLAVIPDDYIASLPADIQVRVRERRGR